MKLKLTDKIRKFFGQAEHEDVDDGDLGAYGGSLEASVANLAAIKPSAARREVYQQHAMPLQAQQRPACSPAGLDQPYLGVAAAEKQAAAHVQLQQQHGSQLPSCTNSQKDAKEFAGGLRTTGQDESYTLQNEVYFPQLLLTLQGGTPEQKAVAAEALFNYTAESDAARQRATQAGVVAQLVDLLRSGTEHGKMYAAYTLSSLTTIDESLEQMHNHGAIPALIDILSTCPLLVCKKGAMRALGRLARSDDAAQEIVAVGGLGPIISLLSRPDSSLVRRCLIALYFIGADKDALQQAIGAAGALPQLLLLARSDSPDVQAEATDVLKVLCRNSSCGRMLAELNGVEVLVATAHAGLTSRAKAAATRALQRLQDIPELKEALAASTARELQLEPSMSPAHSSQLNSSSASPAAAIVAAAAAALPHAGLPMQSPHGASAAAAAMQRSPLQTAHAVPAASAVAAAGPAGAPSTGVMPAGGLAVGGSGPEDLKQLAQVLASGNSRWLREKAAAAVEQLATDNPVACRELAGLGVLPALLDMLDAANSSSTRRAAARALGQLSDDAVMLVHMADAGVVANLLLAAPQLAGSAQQGVMRVLHSLASVPNAITTCFQRQQTVHSMMQILDNATASPAAADAAQRSTMSGGSSGGTQGGADAGVSSRALEVLLSVCRADEAALREIKEYPGGFKLLVSQLQHGPRSTASLILQLLSTLAQHKQHQEDLLKCGVVPTLLTMYRSDDSTVALQAARIMEALSEPASSILQRSLSGNARLADSSSSGSSCGNTPTAAAGAQQQQMPSPLGQCSKQQQQVAQGDEHQVASSSSDSSSDYGACADCSAEGCVEPSRAQQQQGADMLPLEAQHKAGNRPLVSPSHRVVPSVESSATAGRPSGNNHLQILGDDPSNSQTAAAAAAQPGQATPTASIAPSFGASGAQQVTAAGSSQPSPGKSSPSAVPSVSISVGASSSNRSSASPQRNSISPPRRVAAVAAALEAAAMASASADAQPTPTPGRARQQSGIPGLSRAGSKTPTGLGQVPLVVKRPGSGGKAEQGSQTSAQQQQQLQQQQQTMQQAEQSEQPGPSTAAQPVQQPQQHGAALHPEPKPVQQQQQQQHRMQQQIPSRLPRRLPQTPASSSSPGNNASSSGSPTADGSSSGSRTTTPDPMKRRQHTPSVAAAAVATGAGASSRSPSASAVHLRVLAAQKQSQRNMASAAGAAAPAESTSDGTAAAAGAAAGASSSGQQQQQPFEAAGATGRVMQMAAAIAANAEAAARSASPVRIARQPSQPQAQLQQQVAQQPAQQPQQPPAQQQQHELAEQAGPANATPVAAAEAAAAAAVAAGDNCGAGGTAQAAANGSSPAAAAPQVEVKAADGSTPAAPTAAPAPAASAPAAVGAPANGAAARSPSPGKASPVKEKAAGPSNAVAVSAVPPAADADDLLSSTYDNLHGLLLKKGDIEICRSAEGRKCRLGEGGFGVVYKAVMNGVDEVAVKLVKAETPSRKELELFLKEVQTLAKLHHRNIVQFYGACLEMGSMFFVTELMKGGDLYSALRHHSETMKWERLGRKVALDVALGLNYLHAQRPPMMHRDLKSPNVLLSEEGVAKIADVGMVRSQVKDLVTAQPVMTPLWAAPEVVRHERASIKADIWSYGILIWELITGEDITEYQPLSISRQVGPSPNAKAMALPARCPAVARKLFVACTQMDPERRPGAQQLVEWLRADIAASRG